MSSLPIQTLASFWSFAITCAALSVLAIAVAVAEFRHGTSVLAFDIARSISVTAIGWTVTAVSTVLAPEIMAASIYIPPSTMATATLLCFLCIGIGWAFFLIARIRLHRRAHPWLDRWGAHGVEPLTNIVPTLIQGGSSR